MAMFASIPKKDGSRHTEGSFVVTPNGNGDDKMKLLSIILSVMMLGGSMCGCHAGEPDIEAQGKPHFDEWIDYTAEDLQNIFHEHEEAFDYIVQTLMDLGDKTSFGIVIGDKEKGNLLFFSYDKDEEEYTDGSDLGYTKDELFEQYVNDILVGEKFSKIDYWWSGPCITFGHNRPIYYDAKKPAFGEIEESDLCGDLKENWFYYIQLYV